MNSEELYVAIGRLIESQPDMEDQMDLMRWLGRVVAILRHVSTLDASEVSAATSVRLHSDKWAVRDVANAALFRALAEAEMRAPVSSRGSFIPAGNALDAMAAVSKVLRTATKSVRLVDPYMDERTLVDFAPLVDEQISVELLSDEATAKPAFIPAAKRFQQQFGATRPLEARLASPRCLHDRLIIVDRTTVFTVTQSFNALAARSPASIVRIDGDAVPLKIAAYEGYWQLGKAI